MVYVSHMSRGDHEKNKFTDDSRVRTTLQDDAGDAIGSPANPLSVGIADGVNNDAFGRLRVAAPEMQFDAQHHYGAIPEFTQVITGAAAVVEEPNTASLSLTVTGSTGDKVINQGTRQYYQAGLSQSIAMTFNPQSPTSTVELFKRSSVSGVPVETIVQQADWDDPLDGTGLSGETLDTDATNILAMDLQWLGVGRVRFALSVDGRTVLFHELLHANISKEVYMQTASLPCRYEIEKTATGIVRTVGYYDDDDGIGIRFTETTALGGKFMQICSTVFTSGASQILAHHHSISLGATSASVPNGVLTPVLSIRPSALFKGRSNKGYFVPLNMDIFTTGNTEVQWELVITPTLTGAVWKPHPNADSMMEYDLAASSFAGGRRNFGEGYVAGGGAKGLSEEMSNTNTKLRGQVLVDGTQQSLTLLVAGLGGSATVYAALSWAERL